MNKGMLFSVFSLMLPIVSSCANAAEESGVRPISEVEARETERKVRIAEEKLAKVEEYAKGMELIESLTLSRLRTKMARSQIIVSIIKSREESLTPASAEFKARTKQSAMSLRSDLAEAVSAENMSRSACMQSLSSAKRLAYLAIDAVSAAGAGVAELKQRVETLKETERRIVELGEEKSKAEQKVLESISFLENL